MKHREIVKGLMISLALLGGSVIAGQSPAAFAGGPRITVSAAHRGITVSGSHFSASGRAVILDAYGLAGGSKTFLTSATVTPQTTSFDFDPPPAPPCLEGVLCYAGGLTAYMQQGQDPCVSGGFSHLEVDAWTTNRSGTAYEAASARTAVTCPPPFVG